MARYIDADKLTFKLNETQIEFDKNYYGLGEAKQIVDNTPTANVVEREKIDKAIEEISELGKEMNKVQFTKHLVPLDNILEILKRNIGESK